MRAKSLLIAPNGRKTLIFSNKSLPNAKMFMRLNSQYTGYIAVSFEVRFFDGIDFSAGDVDLPTELSNNLSDDLLDEALYQTHIAPIVLPYDSSI